MTEAERTACSEPRDMLGRLSEAGDLDDRKLRLLPAHLVLA